MSLRADTNLLYILRNDFEFNVSKFSCGLEKYGACTNLIDGIATQYSLVPVKGAVESKVMTL
ncbi:hypothetical protein GCM10007278_19380 [Paenalcaligenes hominis]|nr:hypothetical protein GCM10007278_19380 [Paenalcaligenes hominis]